MEQKITDLKNPENCEAGTTCLSGAPEFTPDF
jgi:hypothetical protein